MTLLAFLDLPNGMAVRIGPEGLLLGRHRSCDLQLIDETASRRHALLRVSPDGIELVVLGREPVEINGSACANVQILRAGDRLRFPGLECSVRAERAESSVRADYCLARRSERFPIHSSPFVIGSGDSARVTIAGWPEEALRFRIAQGVLYVELTGESGLHNGEELLPDTPIALQAGDELVYRGETFRIEETKEGDTSTAVGDALTLASAVVLSPLPRGGRVTFTFGDGDRTVYLPGRRYQLIATLVAPPAPHVAGEFIADSALVPLVWDDTNEVGGRQDINVLLTRCRQDLVAGGIAATNMLQRAPGGRATRIRLAPNAKITTASE